MHDNKRQVRAAVILLFCLINIGFGCYGGQSLLVAGGVIGILYAAILSGRVPSLQPDGESDSVAAPCTGSEVPAVEPVDPSDVDGLVERMLAQSRSALLLRPQIAGNLGQQQFDQALAAFKNQSSLVPDGNVELISGDMANGPIVGPQGNRTVHVEPYFLDRYPVTNRQYYEFVRAGGYQDMALWEPKIWPAVLDMVDQTGQPGPRFWRDGRYLPGEEDLPVVGVSWFEAAACARWLGKRLPTDAEWVKAASWPVPVGGETLSQRRFPWGDTMDRSRANIWGSGSNRLVPVGEYAAGANVGGIQQLIGNVWEWTQGSFQGHPSDGRLELPTPMKPLRGGAFDTYFDNQSTCHFQSGDSPLARRHNVGFRSAIGMCDLVLAWSDEAQAGAVPVEEPEEVGV